MHGYLYLQRIQQLFDLFVEKRRIVAKVRTIRISTAKEIEPQDTKSSPYHSIYNRVPHKVWQSCPRNKHDRRRLGRANELIMNRAIAQLYKIAGSLSSDALIEINGLGISEVMQCPKSQDRNADNYEREPQ